VVQKGTPLGEIFIKFAYITPEELKKWNQTLTQETIFSILSWDSGAYRFDSQDISFNMDCYLPISVERILMEGMHQKDEWPRLLSKIPSRDIIFEGIELPVEGSADTTYFPEEVISSDTTNKNEPITPPSFLEMEMEEHAWLLQWIDGTKTVSQVINHSGVGAFPVYKCLVELLAIGRIKEKEWKPKIEKKRFSSISLKQIVFHRFVLNGLCIAIVFGLFTILFIPSFLGGQSISKENISLGEFSQFTAVNQKDMVQFSLNLYYLKHGHYPVALYELAEDGLFQTEQEQKIALNGFRYRSYDHGKRFDLLDLNEIQKTE